MKKIVLMLLICSSLIPLRANDILANGDFTQGTAHWKGDGKNLSDTDLADPSARNNTAPSSNGILIPLQTKWTRISQIFNTKEKALDCSVTYKFSPGIAFSNTYPGSTENTGIALLETITGIKLMGLMPPIPKGGLLVIISDPTNNLLSSEIIQPNLSSLDEQTSKVTIPHLTAHEEKTLYLAFPPGEGTVTVLKVELTPSQSASE